MEKEMEKVKVVLEDLGKKIVDALKKTRVEADRVAHVAQVKLEMGSLMRQRTDLFAELGEAFFKSYSSPRRSAAGEGVLADLIGQVAEIDRRLSSLKRSLKAAPAAKPARRGRPPKAEAGEAPAKPAKRGRPRKVEAEGAPVKPARRGRPPKKAAEGTAAKPAKRGRPAKKASKASKGVRRTKAAKPASEAVAPAATPTETAE